MMKLQTRIKNLIKQHLCGERQYRLGPVSILLCDCSLSLNLLGSDLQVPVPEEYASTEIETIEVTPTYSYGITLEPLMVHLMGRDGDVCWSSPGWPVMQWIGNPNWLSLVDLVHQRYPKFPTTSILNCVYGDNGFPCLGAGLRFRDPLHRFCQNEEFSVESGLGVGWYPEVVDQSSLENHESVMIRTEDAKRFLKRLEERFADLCKGCQIGCLDFPFCKIGR